MDRGTRLLAATALALLVVGGGAYVAFAGGDEPSSAGSLTVAPVDGTPTASETVAFEALSSDQRELFERARNGSSAVDIPSNVSYEVFVDHRYVRYQNRTYEVAVAVP
ncbi:hypothetical protein [Haloarcula laminariae]|uniref:hypothetical protein n=1 Tax=Haloarcula laminariae TaxID=2961577 RepID=UPI0021CA20E0|nr:hypothetical protein [Halomicroarcula laminariae]